MMLHRHDLFNGFALRHLAAAWVAVALLIPLSGAAPTEAADVGVQLSFAAESISEFQQLAGRFQNRMASVKADPGANPCSDAQLQGLQSQILSRYIQARDALATALAVALPSASPAEYNDFVFSGAEAHPEYRLLAPDERAALARALTAFRDLRYNNADHNLLGQGCDDDFVDMFTEAEDIADVGKERTRDDTKSVGELLDDWMTPSEKHKADQRTGPSETQTKFRMDTVSRDASGFSTQLALFDDSFSELARHSLDFADRLDQLSGCCRDEMCHDPVLAYSYAGAVKNYNELRSAYGSIMAMVLPPEETDNATSIGMGRMPLPDITDIPLDDQLAVKSVLHRFQRAVQLGVVIEGDMRSKGPGCDLEEMRDQGRRIAEPDQDPETGLDAGAEPVSGDDGGGNGEDQPHYRKTGDAHLTTNRDGDCNGGSYNLRMTEYPEFPDVIRPTGSYTIRFTAEWYSTGTQIGGVGFAAIVTFLGEIRSSEEIETRNGSRTFTFTFNGSEIDFNRSAEVISVTMGGGIHCDDGSSDAVSTVVSQAYQLHGGN